MPSKQSREEILKKKREAERARLLRIKSDPIKLAEYKEKERQKYLKKIERGQRKTINQMTDREKRSTRRKWREYSSSYRQKQAVAKNTENYIHETTPPLSDNEAHRENIPPLSDNEAQQENRRLHEAKRRSHKQRKLRNKQIKQKDAMISLLKKKIKAQRQKYKRLREKTAQAKKVQVSPKTRIENMAENPEHHKEVVKKAIFGEILKTQIDQNYEELKHNAEKATFKKAITGKLVDKYKLWRYGSTAITYKKTGHNLTTFYKRNSQLMLQKMVQEFLEDDTIWAHLKPVLATLPSTIENIHFLSDGPVTQYRNKSMFYFLGCKLDEMYPNVTRFTWNYHEAGHGKGAPDGVGATCKRMADDVIARGGDISDIKKFAAVVRERCPSIHVSVIEEEEIDQINAIISESSLELVAFKGTLSVHQVTGSVYLPNQIVMKSLSCFCNPDGCEHYTLGCVKYKAAHPNTRLNISSIFTDSEDDNVPLSTYIMGNKTNVPDKQLNISTELTDSEDDNVPLSTYMMGNKTNAPDKQLNISTELVDLEDDNLPLSTYATLGGVSKGNQA
nr:unnamed protein product [Callosobruchus analis]